MASVAQLKPDRAPDIERMLAAYGDSLLRMAFLYLGDASLAQDAVQETFLRVFTRYDSFNGQSGERTWVTRIAANVCKDMLRRARALRFEPESALADIPSGPLDGAATDPTVSRAILKLPQKLREVVVLHYYEDLSIAQTAAALGIGQSAVKTRLSRARAQLKQSLKGWYFDA